MAQQRPDWKAIVNWAISFCGNYINTIIDERTTEMLAIFALEMHPEHRPANFANPYIVNDVAFDAKTKQPAGRKKSPPPKRGPRLRAGGTKVDELWEFASCDSTVLFLYRFICFFFVKRAKQNYNSNYNKINNKNHTPIITDWCLCWGQFFAQSICHNRHDPNRSPSGIRLSLGRPICRVHIVGPQWIPRPNLLSPPDRPVVYRLCIALNFPHPIVHSIRWNKSRKVFSWIYRGPWRCVECHRTAKTVRGFVLRWCKMIDCPRIEWLKVLVACLVRVVNPTRGESKTK